MGVAIRLRPGLERRPLGVPSGLFTGVGAGIESTQGAQARVEKRRTAARRYDVGDDSRENSTRGGREECQGGGVQVGGGIHREE